MNPLLNRVAPLAMAPLKAVNIVVGGNLIDGLQRGSPLIRRASKNFWKISSKNRRKVVKRYGTAGDKKIYRRERAKTHLGRAIAAAGALTYFKNREPDHVDYYY